MERLSGREIEPEAPFGIPMRESPLTRALGERVGNIGRYLTRRYEQQGWASTDIAVEVEELCGIRPTGQTVRNWLDAIGLERRNPRERDSASYMWTSEAISTRNEVMRSPRMRKLQSKKMKRYWKRRSFEEYKAKSGSPFATIRASK